MIEVEKLVKGTTALAKTNERVLKDAAELAMMTIEQAFPEMVEAEDNRTAVFDIVCNSLNRNVKKH